jgi:hypothetical protein
VYGPVRLRALHLKMQCALLMKFRQNRGASQMFLPAAQKMFITMPFQHRREHAHCIFALHDVLQVQMILQHCLTFALKLMNHHKKPMSCAYHDCRSSEAMRVLTNASENAEHQNLSVHLMTEIQATHSKAPKLQKVLEMSVS